MIHGSLLEEDWSKFGLKSWLLPNAGQHKAQWYFLLLSDMWAHGDKKMFISVDVWNFQKERCQNTVFTKNSFLEALGA